MKIDLSSIDREQFVVRDCDVGGDECALVFPSHLGVDWRPDNLHLRSVIFRKRDGLIVSAGLKKFFNLLEKPHLYAAPEAHRDWRITTKLDGSLICVSCHNGQHVVRTRQTRDIQVHETADEVLGLIDRHNVIGHPLLGCGHSFIFEHCTPSLPIVVRYDKPSLTLLKIVQHDGYVYLPPSVTDHVARELGVGRPEVHSFSSLAEIVETCRTLKGAEGYVLEYNGGRDMVKIKGLEYLRLHSFRSSVSLSNLTDLFFTYSRPTESEFLVRIENELDYECAQMARELVSSICTAHDRAIDRVKHVRDIMDYTLFDGQKAHDLFTGAWVPARRDWALAIQGRFEGLDRSLAFSHYDKKSLDDKMLRKLMEEELEKVKTALDKTGESVVVSAS